MTEERQRNNTYREEKHRWPLCSMRLTVRQTDRTAPRVTTAPTAGMHPLCRQDTDNPPWAGTPVGQHFFGWSHHVCFSFGLVNTHFDKIAAEKWSLYHLHDKTFSTHIYTSKFGEIKQCRYCYAIRSFIIVPEAFFQLETYILSQFMLFHKDNNTVVYEFSSILLLLEEIEGSQSFMSEPCCTHMDECLYDMEKAAYVRLV